MADESGLGRTDPTVAPVPGLPPTLEERFRVLRVLGEGTYGRVVLAIDRELRRRVAIKLLLGSDEGEAENRARFLREAQLLARITSDHVTEVFDHGEADGQPYMVTRFVDGPSLRAFIRESDFRVPFPTAVTIFRDVLEGLSVAHKQGVVHRDLKPANILLTVEGRAVVADFGLGKDWDSKTLTREGRMVGSPLYMSAQQMQGQRMEPGWDVFAAALVFCEMITGDVPGFARNIQDIFQARCADLDPGLRAVAPEIPAPLEALLADCLATDAARRPPTAGHLLKEMDKVLMGSSADRDAVGDEVRTVVTDFARSWKQTEAMPAISTGSASAPVGARGPSRTGFMVGAFFVLAVLGGALMGRLAGTGPGDAAPPASSEARADGAAAAAWAKQLEALRKQFERDPIVRKVLGASGRSSAEEAQVHWDAARERFLAVSRQAGLKDLCDHIRAGGRLDPGWFSQLSWLKLYQDLLTYQDDRIAVPLFPADEDPDLEGLLSGGRSLRLVPGLTSARDQQAGQQVFDRWLQSETGKWKALRTRETCLRFDPEEKIPNYQVKLLNPLGRVFHDPTAKVPSILLDSFYEKNRRARVRAAPAEFEWPLSSTDAPVYVVSIIRRWSPTKPVMLEIPGREETLHVQFGIPPGATKVEKEGTNYYGFCLRLAPELLPEGATMARGTMRGLPNFGSFYLTLAVGEAYQLESGPPPAVFRD